MTSGSVQIGQEILSSSEVLRRAARVATGFSALGIAQGDSVALLLRNDFPFFEAVQAARLIGAYAVPINWHCTVEEMRHVMSDSGAKVIVGHADLLEKLAAAVPAGVRVVSVRTPALLAASYGILMDAVEPPSDALEWTAWRDNFAERTGPAAEVGNSMFYTSGTTGKPKGVRRGAFSAAQSTAFLTMLKRCYGIDGEVPENVSTAVVGPMYHAAPHGHANVMFGFGARILVFPRFDPEQLLQAIEKHRITHVNLVPIMFTRLLKLPAEVRSKYDLSSLRFVATSSAPCPVSVMREMIRWLGPIVSEYYGSTEMCNVAMCNAAEWLEHPGTVGKPLPGATVRVVDERGKDTASGVVGEVIGLYRGLPDFDYHNDEGKRQRVEKFGLISPGDRGYFDENGYLYLCDRSTDMIISGGVNIYPAEIEAELHKLESLEDCAVFGIPDEEYGESVCAVVQARPRAEITEEIVRTFLKGRIAGYKMPKKVVIASELPREDSGKIFKRKLREPYWAESGRSI